MSTEPFHEYVQENTKIPDEAKNFKTKKKQFSESPALYISIFCGILLLVCLITLVVISLFMRASCNTHVAVSMQVNKAVEVNKTIKVNTVMRKKTTAHKNQHGQPCFYQQVRLPQDIQPRHYSVHLHPNLTVHQPRYKGNVTIYADCKGDTNHLIFHSNRNIINRIKVVSHSPTSKTLFDRYRENNETKWEECVTLDQVYVPFGRESCEENGKITIFVDFEGSLLNRRLQGFFLDSYEANGRTLRMALTQMEPTYARSAFPCFDEPEMKATFQFDIVRDQNYFTLFNAPLSGSIQLESNLVMDKFQSSELMSSYLVAYVIAPNDYVHKETMHRNVTIRVYGPKSREADLELALDATKMSLQYFEEMFGINYSMSKLDSFSVPFFGGGMENWGLIIYRQGTFLFNKQKDNLQLKQNILQLIAHEVSHQWFGNFATMKWWNDIYLNEAFANYFQFFNYLRNTTLEPAGNIINLERYIRQIHALQEDGHKFTRPVAMPHYEGDLSRLFDTITYSKGGALLRMLESFIGLEDMKKALSFYLKRYLYSNADSSDLWNVITEVYQKLNPQSTLNIKDIMNTWTDQSNHPIVHIQISKDGKSFTARQNLFPPLDTEKTSWPDYIMSPYNFTWSIPLIYFTNANRSQELVWLMREKEKTFALNAQAKWIKVNHGHNGYFVTNYDDKTWRNIISQLQTDRKVISNEEDRAGFLYDAFEISRRGMLSVDVPLDLLSTLKSENGYLPWKVAKKYVIEPIEILLLMDSVTLQKFNRHLKEIVSPLLQQQNSTLWNASVNDLPEIERMTRDLILQVALQAGEQTSLISVKKLFKNYLKNEIDIGDPNTFSTVLKSGIQRGGQTEWDIIWDRFVRNSEQGFDSTEFIQSLAATENLEVIHKLLLDPAYIPKVQPQLMVKLFSIILSKSIAADTACGIWKKSGSFAPHISAGPIRKLFEDKCSQSTGAKLKRSYHVNLDSHIFINQQNESNGSFLHQIRAYYNRKYPC